ncbi:2-phospho-L-lactate guanylyltransferase [Streptomyces gilvosporeus]|uniref:Phosphoenolpyruvate guanylyltransferase n=1 Tax=Streptomyces gilvosporeus TaxID=553510 RepID=A0A1V0TY40_9ACTN|nr:2-phospho-L-lactate guanylyltransferase [Streptomyces gilvosporeus]ARF57602.1 2-phospho-L-lactate guanylyltransferase [Streptomyces gilvosporeus]
MTRDGADAGWSLVVPLKPLVRAKSRLSQAAGEDVRPRLALAFALDTVAAALACTDVRDVAVVTDDHVAGERLAALGARIVPDTPGGGLNAALAHGARAVRARRPGAAVAALNADLPALRPAELELVLHSAALFPRAFLADAADIGTTLLTARCGVELAPAFGGASRLRHLASGAREITAPGVPSVRRDVDTGEDLRAALALGVGPYTAAQVRGPVGGAPAGAGGPEGPREPVEPQGPVSPAVRASGG